MYRPSFGAVSGVKWGLPNLRIIGGKHPKHSLACVGITRPLGRSLSPRATSLALLLLKHGVAKERN